LSTDNAALSLNLAAECASGDVEMALNATLVASKAAPTSDANCFLLLGIANVSIGAPFYKTVRFILVSHAIFPNDSGHPYKKSHNTLLWGVPYAMYTFYKWQIFHATMF
jgi:hypothetical protein